MLNNAERAENVKLVMLINYILFQYALKFSSKNQAPCWPTIQLADRTFYPMDADFDKKFYGERIRSTRRQART